MTTSHRRIALLTGASLAALGITSPALAAPHDGLADGTYAGADTTTDTVTICDLASTTDCFFGVIDSTGAPAIVNSTASGLIRQHNALGDISLTLVNAGGDNAEIGAISTGGTVGLASIATAAIR